MGTYCFGIDVGGTTVKCGLFRTDGTLVEKWEIPTRKENNGDQILPDVAAAVNAKMEELTGLHAEAGNDANVAALGEAWKGAAAGSSDVIMVPLGTGVGGGIIVDGKIVTGHHGAGGRSDMPMWIIMKQNHATAETGAVWNSMLLRPELSAWQKKSLQLPVRTVFSEMPKRFQQKQFWTHLRRMIR